MSLWYNSVPVVQLCPCGTTVTQWYKCVPLVQQCPCSTTVSLWYNRIPVVQQCLYRTNVHVVQVTLWNIVTVVQVSLRKRLCGAAVILEPKTSASG